MDSRIDEAMNGAQLNRSSPQLCQMVGSDHACAVHREDARWRKRTFVEPSHEPTVEGRMRISRIILEIRRRQKVAHEHDVRLGQANYQHAEVVRIRPDVDYLESARTIGDDTQRIDRFEAERLWFTRVAVPCLRRRNRE